MESRIPLPATLPFPPGESPFHTKGSVWLGARRQAELDFAGGMDGLAATLGDPALAAFCKQRFLSNAWYDYLPILLVVRATALAHMRNQDDLRSLEQLLEGSAAQHAERDLGGVYKILLRFTSPEAAMRRLPQVTQQYYDFSASEVTVPEPGVAETLITGWPAIALPMLKIYNAAFMHRLIALSGGRNPAAEWRLPEPDGSKAGVSLIKIRVRTTWK
jgi:hypothetical protein